MAYSRPSSYPYPRNLVDHKGELSPIGVKEHLEQLYKSMLENDSRGEYAKDKDTDIDLKELIVRPEWYGAKGDGVHDDTAAIQAAMNFASTLGRTVVLAPLTYVISDTLLLPPNVNLIGQGQISSEIIASVAMDAVVLSVGTPEVNSAGGIISHVKLNANNYAQKSLSCEVLVNKTFMNIRCVNAIDVGLLLNGTQNCIFINCDMETNGSSDSTYGGGTRLNHGAANNVFLRCEFNKNRQRSVVMCSSDSIDPDIPSGYYGSDWIHLTPCHGNRWYGCMIERNQAETVGQVYIRAGFVNTFDSCELQADGSRIIIELTDEDGINHANLFSNLSTYGSGVTHTFIKSRMTGPSIGGNFSRITGCTVGTCATVFDCDDNTRLVVDDTNFYAGGTLFTTTGTYTQDQVLGSSYYTVVNFSRAGVFLQGVEVPTGNVTVATGNITISDGSLLVCPGVTDEVSISTTEAEERSLQVKNSVGGTYFGVTSSGVPFVSLLDGTGAFRSDWITGSASTDDIEFSGDVNIKSGQVYKVYGTQVVGAQALTQAALKADYTTGDLDTEAEIIAAINATNAGFNALLAKIKTHGLLSST